jgi:hypothetical protein
MTKTREISDILTGVTIDGDVSFGDNDKAIFGAGTDLQIYHDGSNSAIQNATGELFVYGGGDQIRIRAENSKESIVANQNGAVDLYFNGVQKFETKNSGITVEGTVSANRVIVSAVDINSASTKYRQHDMSTGSGGGSFLLGKIENNSSTNGAVSGKLYFAYDYGTTTDSATINFTFSQRAGAARGQWWYEHDDQDSVADRVSVKLIDDGAGGMFVWVVAADYATIAAETVWRSSSIVTTSGQVTAGTITTGTTLFDTANDPTSEMHIGKLFAHSDINVDGNVTATAFYGDGSNLTGITVAAASVGTSATLQTKINTLSATMATSIGNSNSAITALSATMATSIGNSNSAITALSATMATSIGNSNSAITALSATMATSIGNSNSAIATLSATLATSISNYLPLAGGTVTGNVSFGDNNKAIFGAGSDLQIYHDGSNSYVKDAGTGDLYIQGTQLRLQSATGESFFVGVADGAAYVYHNGSAKLNTTSTGIGVTGNIKLDAQNAGIQLKSGATGSEGLIKWTFNTDSTVYAKAGIAYNTRATDGFLLDVAYPITLDATTNIKFKIAGSEEMRLEADGDLHVDGNVIAYSTTISDKRLKKDIAPIDNALWRVSQLNGCTFTYLKDDRKSAGLIAQDLEKVLPSAVIEDEAVFHGEEGETYKTVQYDQVIGLLVEAVKELTAKVEELENASTK